MNKRCIRVKNRLLQAMYRPKASKKTILPAKTLHILDEIERKIEEKITPLLAELFE